MPKAVQFKANSIVYFKGDLNESIYILKSGKVVLKYNDIETGQELNELIQTGEFFGVKSSLGKYPKEETAIVLQDSEMLVFTVPEFELMAMKNTRIIMKMLKVFSNQLRRIHKQVRNLISTGGEQSLSGPEEGLFKIGEYYLKRRQYKQALYVFRRYLTFYPTGKLASEATRNIELSESAVQGGSIPRTAAPVTESRGRELNDVAKSFYNAVSIFSQEKYGEALKEFNKIAEQNSDEEYLAKALFEIGRCHFSMNDFDKCIAHYTGMIQRYPKHPDLLDALFYVGNCYEKKGDTNKAEGFYTKILSMAPEDEPVNRKAKKALRMLKGR